MLLLLSETKDSIEKELISFYRKYGKDGVITYAEARKWVSLTDRRKRLNALLAILLTKFDNLETSLEIQFEILENRIVNSEFEFFELEVPNEVFLIPWGLDNSTWKDRLREDVDLWYFNIGNDIKRAVMRGDSIEKILKQLDKRFNSIEYILRRLGMSESSATTSLARKIIFKQLGIKNFKYYARADERTCTTCGSMHGRVFPISAYEIGVTAPPMHPNCRCWTVPILE